MQARPVELVGWHPGAVTRWSGPPPARRAARVDPAEITAQALADPRSPCGATLARFCAILGAVAGDIALTTGARGGVYIAGGIAPRILPFLKASPFRERFERKGRFQDYMAAIPTHVTICPLTSV